MNGTPTADLVIPIAAVSTLSVPDLAVTDGSGGPEWVKMPYVGGFRYRTRPAIDVPLDAETASVARRWLRFRSIEDRILTPGIVLLCLIDSVLLFWASSIGDVAYVAGLVFFVGIVALASWGWWGEKRFLRPSFPRLEKRRTIYIRSVPVDVCREWVARNPEVRMTDGPGS